MRTSKRMTVWVVRQADNGFAVRRGNSGFTFVCWKHGRRLFGSLKVGIPQKFELTAKKLKQGKGKQ